MEKKEDECIKKCIEKSCVEKKDETANIFSFDWRTSLASFKDDLLYNYFRFNSKFDFPITKIHLYNKVYNTFHTYLRQISSKIHKNLKNLIENFQKLFMSVIEVDINLK